MTSGFDDQYRKVNVTSDVFNAWNLAPNSNACSQAEIAYEAVGQEAAGYIDTALSRIDPIHAQALGMDSYAYYLGTRDEQGVVYPMNPPPSAVFAGTGIRDFDKIVTIIATPDQELTQTIVDLETRKTIISSAGSNMESGITQRTDWIKDQYRIYGTLIHRLEMAQNSHVTDDQALADFFSALASQYTGAGSMNTIFQDVASVAGGSMKTQYDAWKALVPDITYYRMGDNWIRNEDNLSTRLYF